MRHSRHRLPILLGGVLAIGALAAMAPAGAAARASRNPSGASMPGAVPGFKRVFADNFAHRGLGAFQVYNGPGADPGVCWAASHAVVTRGELVLEGDSDPSAAASLGCTATTYEYVTAGLKLTVLSRTYGRYEVRARVDSGQGVSLAAQLWPTDDDWNNGIVFMEDNGQPSRLSNLATEYSPGIAVNRRQLSVDMTRWHTYGVIWKRNSVIYTIDGRRWATLRSADIPRIPMQLALQTESWRCGANSWEQCVSPSSPAHINMDVDWVVAYAPSVRRR